MSTQTEQVIKKQIISISPATGWRAVFALETDDSGVKPDIEPVACFAAVRIIWIKPGNGFCPTLPLETQKGVEWVQEMVEPHVHSGDVLLECVDDAGPFFRLLAPVEDWTEDDQKAMENRFTGRNLASS